MVRIFAIEYPGDLGEVWLNEKNLLLCLNAYCHGVEFRVENVTGMMRDYKEGYNRDRLSVDRKAGAILPRILSKLGFMKTRTE